MAEKKKKKKKDRKMGRNVRKRTFGHMRPARSLIRIFPGRILDSSELDRRTKTQPAIGCREVNDFSFLIFSNTRVSEIRIGWSKFIICLLRNVLRSIPIHNLNTQGTDLRCTSCLSLPLIYT